MSLQNEQYKFALNVADLIRYINQSGYSCTLGEVFRTKEQAELNVKNGTGILDSNHCRRLAIDINLFSPTGKFLIETKDYYKFGQYWESLDPLNRWGGGFPKVDADHFERNYKES
ncbi:MAG TPA: M15 family metallopeptidase [Bacteroidia bacterium]|jgi:hypothetical protein|nr:M15 family metallopeptidase [Bacteroidia bacterium]